MSNKIPDNVKKQVDEIVDRYNRETIIMPDDFFSVRYRGRFAYLDRNYGGPIGPRGRLEYNGSMDNWGFAIYKYSSDRYDPDEWMFPGSGHLDGTVEGALKACTVAYP